MRLFAALVPPGEVLDEVEAAIRPYAGQVPGLRWPERATWHITLGFFGEVPEEALPDLLVRLERAVHRHQELDLAFEGFGGFSSLGRARVFWVGTSGDSLRRLGDSVRAAGRRAGAEHLDDRPLHAHLTLARARHELDLRPLADSLAGFHGSPWRARTVQLIRSHQERPMRYESLAEWALAPLRRG
jgi:RNA 2',3'-cyclic 3'-phosphodiesterase